MGSKINIRAINTYKNTAIACILSSIMSGTACAILSGCVVHDVVEDKIKKYKEKIKVLIIEGKLKFVRI